MLQGFDKRDMYRVTENTGGRVELVSLQEKIMVAMVKKCVEFFREAEATTI